MMIENKLKIFAFPVLFTGVLAILLAWPGKVLPAYLALTGAIALGVLLERIIPYSRDWQAGGGDWKIDAVFAMFTALLAPAVSTMLVALVAQLAGSNRWSLAGWTASVPLTVQVALALPVSGFLPYAFHRIAHESEGFLWRSHAIHHSPGRLYWLNALRLHPVNVAWNVAGGLLPLLLLGFDREAIFLAGNLNNLVALLNHMNVDFRLGPLNYVFNMSELHRWHHSKLSVEANTNFSGGALCVWDLALGTFFLPKRRTGPGALGLYESSARSFPSRSFGKQVLYPFCRCADAA